MNEDQVISRLGEISGKLDNLTTTFQSGLHDVETRLTGIETTISNAAFTITVVMALIGGILAVVGVAITVVIHLGSGRNERPAKRSSEAAAQPEEEALPLMFQPRQDAG